MTSYTTLEVQNFKGIREMKLEGLGMVNVFVGGNNVGKTSVLQAIHLGSFLDFKEKSFKESIKDNKYLNKMNLNDAAREMVRVVSKFWGERKQVEDLLYLRSTNGSWSLTMDQKKIQFSQNDFFPAKNSTSSPKLRPGSDQYGNILWIMSAYEHHFLATDVFPDLKKDIKFLYQLIEQVVNNLKKTQLIEVLKPLQKNLITIELLGDAIGCQLEGANKLLNMKEMGEGFLKLALLKALLLNLNTPYIFIDEIENGFHWSVQKDMWRMILTAAKDDGTQFFFTTHSYEVLESLNAVLQEMKDNGESLKVDPKEGDATSEPLDLACVFELEKSTDDVVTYTKYQGLALEGAIINGIEIRGRNNDKN